MWEYNIKIYLRDTGWGGMNWINLLGPVQDSCEHGGETSLHIKSLDFLEQLGNWWLLAGSATLSYTDPHNTMTTVDNDVCFRI